MTFSENDRLKAIAIVNIFETGRPFGEYGAIAVLNDGAGISYGINQFTHRSGALAEVVTRYLESGGEIGAKVLRQNLGLLRSSSGVAIAIISQSRQVKAALRAAAVTRQMREAQHDAAYRRFMLPAAAACEGSGFVLPLSLAVVYDSINHGSWDKVRDQIRTPPASRDFEKSWITAYVKARHNWLRSIPRLKATAYRTSFFLAQIIAGNWQLELPVKTNGFLLTNAHFPPYFAGAQISTAGHLPTPMNTDTTSPAPSNERENALPAETARPSKTSADAKGVAADLADVFAKYERIESLMRTVVTRTDAAKSLWTTVAGTAWQAFWAITSFLIGLPREVWLAVALIAAALMLLYLYRQVALGRIREISQLFAQVPRSDRRGITATKNNE